MLKGLELETEELKLRIQELEDELDETSSSQFAELEIRAMELEAKLSD